MIQSAIKLTPGEGVDFALADPLYGADFRITLERLLAKTPVKVRAQEFA